MFATLYPGPSWAASVSSLKIMDCCYKSLPIFTCSVSGSIMWFINISWFPLMSNVLFTFLQIHHLHQILQTRHKTIKQHGYKTTRITISIDSTGPQKPPPEIMFSASCFHCNLKMPYWNCGTTTTVVVTYSCPFSSNVKALKHNKK